MACSVRSIDQSSPSALFAQSVGDQIDFPDCGEKYEIICWIKRHPIAAVAIAAGIGILLGRR